MRIISRIFHPNPWVDFYTSEQYDEAISAFTSLQNLNIQSRLLYTAKETRMILNFTRTLSASQTLDSKFLSDPGTKKYTIQVKSSCYDKAKRLLEKS